MTKKTLALVGVGAISRAFYLPALEKLRDRFSEVWTVDPNEHALSIVDRRLQASTATRLSDIKSKLDYVVVAAPNSTHLGIAEEALARGSDVLIEKPFVVLPNDGDQLVRQARGVGKTVAVNQTRRFFPMLSELRALIDSAEYGRLLSIDHCEGVKLNWPYESGAAFSPTATRTGAIMDFGVHVLDFYQYLLQDPSWEFQSSIHDGFVGPEGLAEIHVLAGNIPLHLRLSRYFFLRNTARLQFEGALIEFECFDMNTFTVTKPNGSTTRVFARSPLAEYGDVAPLLIEDLLAATRDGRAPRCDAASSLPVIRILDEIYRRAERYPDAVGEV
jgi:predicted dehydrogenase